MVSEFERNKAETTTIVPAIPAIPAFQAAPQLTDVIVVADAGMIVVWVRDRGGRGFRRWHPLTYWRTWRSAC
jgi:hypothetical protein